MQSTEIAEHESGYKALTQTQVASFWEDGFLVVGKVLQDELIEEMRREYDDEFSLERRSQRPSATWLLPKMIMIMTRETSRRCSSSCRSPSTTFSSTS